jgi:hypothetical protein
MPLVQFIGFGHFFRGESDSFIRRYYINIQTRFNFKDVSLNWQIEYQINAGYFEKVLLIKIKIRWSIINTIQPGNNLNNTFYCGRHWI